MIEARVPADVRANLAERGHRLELQGDFSSWMGGGQAVIHDSANAVNYGASSPRKDGAAVPGVGLGHVDGQLLGFAFGEHPRLPSEQCYQRRAVKNASTTAA